MSFREVEGVTWLASYPKSGSTWVRAFLTAYKYDSAVDLHHIEDIQSDCRPEYVIRLSGRPLNQLTIAEKMFFRSVALYHQIATSTYRPTFLKTHFANRRLRNYRYIPKEVTARAIYLVRDPRDVALSFSKHMDLSVEKIVELMNEEGFLLGTETDLQWSVDTWSAHVKSWAETEDFPVIVVRYEDLRAEPEKWFSKMLDFCGVEVDEKKVERAVENTQLKKLQHKEAQHGFYESSTSTFFGKGGVGAWRDKLPDDLRTRIEREHGEQMKKLDYLSHELKRVVCD